MVADYRIGPAPVLAGAEAVRTVLEGCVVGLFKNEDIPEDWQNVNEYDEPSNSGYDRLPVTFNSPVIGPPNVARWLAVPPTWEPVSPAGQEYVYGFFFYSEDDDEVVLVVKNVMVPFVTVGPFYFTLEMTSVFSPFD